MNTEKENLEKISDYVTLTVEHKFTDQELLKKSSELAGLTREIDQLDAKKKATAAEYKNKIDILKAQVKLVSDAITNKWENQDRACELYLDFENKVRIYDDKITGEELKREPFHQGDFEKRQLKMFQEEQIAENNAVGAYVNAEPDADGFYRDEFGNLTDIPPRKPLDALDAVIIDKKVKGGKKEKPQPKELLHPNYGKDFEPEDDFELPE
jgi:hypothetical protein